MQVLLGRQCSAKADVFRRVTLLTCSRFFIRFMEGYLLCALTVKGWLTLRV